MALALAMAMAHPVRQLRIPHRIDVEGLLYLQTPKTPWTTATAG